MKELATTFRLALTVLLCCIASWPGGAEAVPNGYTGVTSRDSASGCGGCHAQDPGVQVAILGANSLAPGATGTYTIRARKQNLGNGAVMGFLVAAGDNPSPLNEANLNTSENDASREVYHNWQNNTYPLNTTATVNDGGINYGTATYTFTFTMPAGAAAGSQHVLYSVAVLGFDTGAGAQTQWNGGSANNFTIYAPPAAPATLNASGAGSASVNLSWSGGGPHYRVVYKTGASAPTSVTDGTTVDLGAVTSTTLTGLSPSTQYTARLYSKIAGESVYSTTGPTATFTTLATASTSTALSSSLNPALVGQIVTFTATVSSSGGTPMGPVTFKDGTTPICSAVELSGGQAQCATSSLAQGTHSITAEYAGGTGFFASTSTALSQVVRVPQPRYVNAATGVNAGDCTSSASPCKTITYAMSQAAAGNPGDSISVAPGTYNVGLGEVFPISFKSGVDLVATGTPANTIIDGAGDTVQNGIFFVSSPASGRLEGFTIANGVYQADQYANAQGGAVRIFSASSFTVTRNVFSNNEARGFPGLDGFNFRGGLALGGALYVSFSNGITISNNVFTGNVARGGNGLSHGTPLNGQENGGTGEGGAVYIDSVNGAVTNNTFRGNSAVGGNGGTASNGTGNGGDARGGGAKGNSTLTIVNNIFSANAATAGTGGTPGTATAGAAATASGSSSNNLAFGNTVNGGASSGDSLGTASLSADPQFHSPPSNLHIRPSSPAAGSGTATGAPTVDFDGVTRPNPPAIGAFEPTSTTTTYNLVLEGWQQVSPYVVTPATGSGTAVYDLVTKQITFNLAYSGLSSAESAAHIHGPATRGANAGVLVSLSGANPKVDVVTLTAEQETQLFAGQLYVNIHTATYGAGELRAQIDNAGATVTRVLTVSKAGTGAGTATGTAEPGTVINCGSDCTETVPNGRVVALTATPAGGSLFAGWSGACTGTGACNVTMDAAKAVTATFDLSDTTPDAFGFVDVSNVALGTVQTSNVVTIAGITAPAAISVSGGSYSIGCGSTFVTTAGTISNGQTVCVRHTSSAINGTATHTTLTVGGVSDTFTSTTLGTAPAAPAVSLSTTSLAFGGQSMGTTSPAMTVTVTNTGNATLSIAGVTIDNAQFARTHDCASVAPSLTCTINATFSPATAAGALNSTTAVTGTLTITSNATGSPHAVSLSGTGEKSLVSHYYRSVLRRAPDAGGKTFWQNEAARVAGLGGNVNEVWFALSAAFYVSAEYAAFGRNNTAFVTDLYTTFFNRMPDSGGQSFWVGNLDQGMPREVALAEFMFSAEFRNFGQAIFGSTAVRAEIDMVMDFYRGLLARLPDDGGFAYWRDRFRAAQCQGQAAVVAEVEAISSAFTTSTEYTGRNRTDAQYVGDLYNAFLRRGGDLPGVQYWIGTLSRTSPPPLSREQLRVQFKNSAEFQARVNAVIQQGCLQ